MTASSVTLACEAALSALAAVRRDDQICISNQMSARLWPGLSQHPLDFNYLSSTMGGAIPLGLGLALARPDREVIVISGDGSLLMNLGCLVSVIAANVSNLTILLLDNGTYEVTGGQRTPGEVAGLDYGSLARSVGFPVVAACSDWESWQACLGSAWQSSGPRFLAVRVLPVSPGSARTTSTCVADDFRRLSANLAASRRAKNG